MLQFNIRNDQGAAKASILKLMQNIQLKVVIFFMNLWIAKNIISVFIKWTQFEVVSQVQLRKQIVETMVACHMKAKYIYTYLNTNTNTNANAPSSSSVIDFVGLYLSFCHHHPFAFVQFVALWRLFDAFDAMNLMFAEQTEVFANQIWIFVQPNWIFAQGPLSFLRWNIEH